MKKIIFFLLILFSFFVFFNLKKVNAQTIGAGLFCNRNVTSADDKMVEYKNGYPSGVRYTKGDEVVCYLAVLYDGDTKVKEATFDILDNENFEFKKFKKSSLWDKATVKDGKVTLKSDEGITGNFIVGRIYYTMLNDGLDLDLEISTLYLNNTDVVGMNLSDIINDSTIEEEIPPCECPVVEEQEEDKKETPSDNLILYVLFGIITVLLLLNILQFLIIRRMNKTY